MGEGEKEEGREGDKEAERVEGEWEKERSGEGKERRGRGGLVVVRICPPQHTCRSASSPA